MSIFKSREINSGFTNFDNCQNRTVEYSDFVIDNVGVVETDDLSKETYSYAGSSAELHCPKTNDERVTVEIGYRYSQDRDDALKRLRREAGAQVCRSCVYAAMSPLETSQYDAQVAKSELEKVEALKARALALAELAAIDPAYKHML